MRGRCCIGFIVLCLIGCSAPHQKGERLPVTSERIAELKQLCYSAGPFSVEVPRKWKPVVSPSRRILAFSPLVHGGSDLLYAHAVPKSPDESLELFIASDVDLLSVEHPSLLAAEGDPISIPGAGKQAEVRYLEGDAFGGRSVVAYIDEGQFVGIIGLSSKHPDELDTSYRFFEDIVRSYRPALA